MFPVGRIFLFSWLAVFLPFCSRPTFAQPSATITVTVYLSSTNSGPINLGSCSNFVILAKTTVTSTGGGIIDGDVGIFNAGGSLVGFPPAQITGALHIFDAISDQAQLDLTDAYNDAKGRSVDRITLTDGQDIGGETLAPGLYGSASSLQITGDLTLDAGGNASAVWIFQMGSTLTTAAGGAGDPHSRVLLAGGARAKNVFWQVGSSATLGTYSVFKGTLMADGSITMGDYGTMDGRALARTGAVTFNGTGGSLPQDDFGPLSIQINAPTNVPTYTSLTNLPNLGGTSSDNVGVTRVTLRNNRDVAGFTCTGTDNWTLNSLPLFQGENYLDAIAYDALGNSVTDMVRVAYNGDTQYNNVLFSGNIVQSNDFPTVLIPGEIVTVRWKILSYVPVLSRLYARDPARTWTSFRNGTYVGYEESLFNLYGRHAGIYSFQCSWLVPQKSGAIDLWYNVAQMDGDQYMIPMIPDGVDASPHPTTSKVFQRTIQAGGTGALPGSDPDLWDSARIFETEDQHKMRSAGTITSITCPDGVTSGAQMTCEWKVLSYVPVDSEVMLVNIAPSAVYKIWIGALVNTASTSYTFKDRVSGQIYSAAEYTYRATFPATAPAGERAICFRNKRQVTGSSWMFGNISIRADLVANRPATYNGLQGRFIARTINP